MPGVNAVPAQLIFLPGALGDPEFWRPVGERLAVRAGQVHLGWPGFGPTPPDPPIKGIADLAAMVAGRIDRPTALLAQSMGGVVAVLAALRVPQQVTHLVLAATSGGIDLGGLGAHDWRPAFEAAHPALPQWFSRDCTDLAPRLRELAMPVLLLWGDADPISPVAVGQHLARRLPDAQLRVIAGGAHDLVQAMPEVIAPLIDQHLGTRPRRGKAAEAPTAR